MSKFLEIEVTRAESTFVYIEVPDDWDFRKMPSPELVKAATVKTCDEWDWDDYGWENTLEIQSFSRSARRGSDPLPVLLNHNKRNSLKNYGRQAF